jgi:GT2 family glycosyltransferase
MPNSARRSPASLADSLAVSPADVAVIIPAFNSGGYLDVALASVVGQTVMPGAVVVADDCSTDDTADRARRWQDRLPLEIVRLDQNSGPGIARHRAIQASSTALLAMLDADDFFLPDHLETMIAVYAAHPGLISAQELAWSPAVGLYGPTGTRRFPRPSGQLTALLRHNFVNFGFFSRELYEQAGGFRDQFCEDWDLWIRMVRAGATVAMASHPTAIHRLRSDSRSFDAARTAERGIEALTAELEAASSAKEAAAVRSGLRALRGKLSFYRASQLAAQGRRRQARRTAFSGLPAGSPRTAAGLLALLVAPGTAARLERATRAYRSPEGKHISSQAPSSVVTQPGSPDEAGIASPG